MNFDYVRLLSVELSLLMMNLSYKMLVIICFLLFAYVSLDSSSAQNGRRCSAQIGRVQCKNVYECSTDSVEWSLHIPKKAVHTPTFEKIIHKSKNTKRQMRPVYVVRNMWTCSTDTWSMQCTNDLLSSACPTFEKILERKCKEKIDRPGAAGPSQSRSRSAPIEGESFWAMMHGAGHTWAHKSESIEQRAPCISAQISNRRSSIRMPRQRL